MPLIEWMTVRLDVSENGWRRRNKEMEPQRRGSVAPPHTRRRNRTSGLRETTLRLRAHVHPVGLNAETKTGSAPTLRGGLSLDIPLYRTCPVRALIRSWRRNGRSLLIRTGDFDAQVRSAGRWRQQLYCFTGWGLVAATMVDRARARVLGCRDRRFYQSVRWACRRNHG